MLYYMHDHKLKRSIGSLLDGIERFLALATPESRPPIEASLSWIDPSRRDAPTVTDRMLLKRGHDFQPRVQALLDRARSQADQTGVAVKAHWTPDFIGPETSSFAILGIDPLARQEGANYRHALQLVGTGPGSAWLMSALVLPFAPGSEAFHAFRDEAGTALGFALAPSGFRGLERTKTGSFKLRKLEVPAG